MRSRVTSVGLIVLPDPAEHFEYPSHIDRAGLDALPSKPGVYLFRDRRGRPIYIGKSVNIRSRVLAHLRTPEEACMLQDTRRVDYLRTAGEIGALLLESHLIKHYQPAYNVLLKFESESFAIGLRQGDPRPSAFSYSEAENDETISLYGLFVSRGAAQEALAGLVREHRLCPALLGLESATRGRACFAHQIGRCAGACVGKETRETHGHRMHAALEGLNAAVWPYAGPIGIVETEARWRQVHVIDRWSYVGSLEGRRRRLMLAARPALDIDTYRILAKPLAQDALTVAVCDVKESRNGSRSYLLPKAAG
jgi:excinuclease Cho